ncbi:MAG: S-layer homology domain-containing protein [Lachnospiraceae bacterium]|nr:S-layer homology domain-containing protein [Lachnospiraceae bacterium]
MKRIFIFILSVSFIFSIILTAGAAETDTLTMTAAGRLTCDGYTLGDLAAARLAVYGILDDAYKTPQPETKLPLSRTDAVATLYAAFGDDSSCASPFTDIPDEYADAVAWAYAMGITSGISTTEFGVREITDAEFVTMLLRCMGYSDAFDFEEAISFATTLGLSPTGLSATFCLGDAALYLQCCADTFDLTLNKAGNFGQISFPYLIILTPASLEDAEEQLQAAACYLPAYIRVYGDDLAAGELRELYKTYCQYQYMVKSGAYETEVWWLGKISSSSQMSPSYETVSQESAPEAETYSATTSTLTAQHSTGELSSAEYVYLFKLAIADYLGSDSMISFDALRWSEEWQLACDADDAFTAFEDDTITQLADAFYSECIRIAASDSDYDIVMAAKQLIMRRASYASPISYANGSASYSASAHSVFGFFQNGEIVCDGYSAVFLYVMLRAGIPCVEVTGSTAGADGKINHAWNKVKIDGAWYNIDICWADTGYPTRYDLKSDAAYKNLSHWAEDFTVGAYAAEKSY